MVRDRALACTDSGRGIDVAEHTSFLFANWNPTQIRIVCQLIPLLCRHGAGLYGVDFPRGSDVQEVRVGWPNPNSSNKHILSLFEPRANGVLWELRLTPDCEFISSGGPLRLLKMEKGKEHQESQRAKGCIVLTEEVLPPRNEDWIEEAFTYCRDRYGI